MKLSIKQYAILEALEGNPFKPLSQVADELGITWITAKRQYQKLEEGGILDKPLAVYDHLKLGLQRIVVMCYCPTLEKLQIVEKGCDEHPYTHYRARTLGGRFGLFIQFDCPIQVTQLINGFFTELSSMDVISEFHFFESTGLRTNRGPDLKRFNSDSGTWDFSWEDWFSSIDSYSDSPVTPTALTNDFSHFIPSHFQLLKLLTENPGFSQKEISEKLNLSRTETHRQYNFVKNNYISTMRLRYKRELFNINEAYVALAKSCRTSLMYQIYNGINTNSPPFNLNLDVLNNNGLQIWANMSTNQAISFSYSLWEYIEDCRIHMLNIRNPYSWLYWFYPDNFDFEEMKWRDDWEYVFGTPLNHLIKKFDVLKV